MSGLRSWRVTSPAVASSMARQCSAGTRRPPLCSQFQTCACFTPSERAKADWPPTSFMAFCKGRDFFMCIDYKSTCMLSTSILGVQTNKEFCSLIYVKTYAERLKYAMNSKGLSQSELARGVSLLMGRTIFPQSIQHLCDKKKHAEGSVYTPIFAFLTEVDPLWLAIGKGDPHPRETDGLSHKARIVAHQWMDAPKHIQDNICLLLEKEPIKKKQIFSQAKDGPQQRGQEKRAK